MERPRLSARPRADSLNVESIVLGMARGAYRIPKFQRALKWGTEDRRLLLSSIVAGIPIGSVLLWKHAAEAGSIDIADWRGEVGARSDALWVVDGQQRVSTLFAALRSRAGSGAPPPGYDFAWSLATGDVVDATRPGRDSGLLVPMSAMLDAVELQMWCIGRKLDESTLRRVLEVGAFVRTYPVPSYVIETPDQAVVQEVFARVNSTGKSMRSFEVFDALHFAGASDPGKAAGEQSVPARSGLDGLAQVCMDADFGPLPREWLLKVVESIDSPRPTSRSRAHRDTRPHEWRDRLLDAEPALRRTLAFLRVACSLPHVEALPYFLPVAVLARFFHLAEVVNDRTLALLSRWVWRGLVSAQHVGSNEKLKQNLGCIPDRGRLTADQAEDVVQRLLGLLPQEVGPFRSRRCREKIELVALIQLQPRSLADPEQLLAPSEIFGPEAEFKPVLLEPEGPNVAANRLMLPPQADPAVFRERLRERAADEQWMASHALNGAVAGHVAACRWRQARQERELLLAAETDRLVARKVRVGESDRPSIRHLAGPLP